jgi:hypothetical protein
MKTLFLKLAKNVKGGHPVIIVIGTILTAAEIGWDIFKFFKNKNKEN